MNPKLYFRLLRTYINYRTSKPTPAIVILRLNYKCNLKCFFCKLWKFPEVKELNLNQIKNLINDLAKLGLPWLNITGGEPLLRLDLEEIGAYAGKHGIFTVLNTNGTLITKSRAKQLVKSFNIIKISLDGLEKTHDDIRGVKGTFKKVNMGLMNLLETKNRTSKIILHFVANKKNIHEIPSFIEKYTHMVDTISIMPVFYHGEGKVFHNKKFLKIWKEMDKTYNLQESNSIITKPSPKIGKKYCEAAKLYYSVLPDGRVVCCPIYFLNLGNIKKESFYDIWKRGLTEEQKEKIRQCEGCYSRCTTEVSMFMRKSLFELLLKAPGLIKKLKI